jgi:hypothetical protein
VKCELTSSLNITGIPANIKIIDGLKSVVQAVSSISKEVVNELELTLERNAVSNGIITATSFKNMINDILDQRIPIPTAPIDTHIEEEQKQNNVFHLWGGRIHSLPEIFEFPKCSFRQGLSLWFRGNPGEGIPPLRLISTKDVSSRRKQKYYSDWKYVFNSLVPDTISQTPEEDELDKIFHLAASRIFKASTEKGRKRRFEDLQIRSIANILRKKAKMQATH